LITIVAINAKKDGVHSFFDNIARGTGVNILHLTSIKELREDPSKVIIFHSEQDDKEDWLKFEEFSQFDFPEGTYWVFGSDSGNIIRDIRDGQQIYKQCRFISIPRKQGFKVYFAHCAATIVLWERFKRLNP